MASNFAVDGNEITFVKKLLTELYPNSSFSMVSDTYDYWNNILDAKTDFILHQVNCQGVMGSGVAKTLRQYENGLLHNTC